MTFKMDCPHCMRKLNVTEKAFGKTVPCPGCNQPVKVPQSAAMPPSARPVECSAPRVGSTQDGRTARTSPVQLPPGMPPVPKGEDSACFVESAFAAGEVQHKRPTEALQECPDCGASISRRAEACPHCGCPMRRVTESPKPLKVEHANPLSTGFNFAVGAIFAQLLFVFLLIGGCVMAFRSCVDSLHH